MSSSKRMSYKRNPFAATKKRKQKQKRQERAFDPELKSELKTLDRGSWFEQNKLLEAFPIPEKDINQTSGGSASHKKILDARDIDEYETESDEDLYSSDDEALYEQLEHEYNWIISLSQLQEYLQEVAVCKVCHSQLEVTEERSCRAGLGTKLHFKCNGPSCGFTSPGFNTTPKSGFFYSMNRLCVIAGRLIGKGRPAMNKLSSVMGLSPPVSKQSYAHYTKYVEAKAFDLLQKNLSRAASKIKDEHGTADAVIDTPVSFDGSWKKRGWTSKGGIATAVAENTGQVIDIVYKSSECRQCSDMKLKREKEEVPMLEYLKWYEQHEPGCLLNHDGSPHVSTNL